MTDNAAPSSTLPQPAMAQSGEDLLSRWRHSGEVGLVEPEAPMLAAQDTDESSGLTTSGPGAGEEEAPGEGEEAFGDDAPRRAGRARRLFSHLTVARTMVSVVLIAALGAAGWFAYQNHTNSAAAADRAAAVNAAKSDALALATYDYNHLNQFFAEVKSFSTPGFGTTFNKGAQSLVKVLTQYKATSSAKLASYGVKSASGNRVTVLVVVDQTVANSASKTPSAQTEAFEYTMVHQGGRWLLDVAASVH
ncbi:hypothetical protein K6U06_21075 [Acidiferrimicrobium sp. IK]|uniref:hypothetical protein n=1 Tax=Acidiferrimicrobium sp. IK TaxID=2871700 RepID=UPI0021CAFB60|nr:hypothetical protein [Acidiferrimicrobium sp. IK]MCU4186872.1 hypothetical protein [Acidiferrimicrobium sp. IK]